MCASANNWVVRLVRKDNETRMYWFDRCGNTNARVSSALLMTKEEAVQFAKALNSWEGCPFRARAFRYETSKAQKEAALAAARKPDTLKTEEQVELEDLRAEVKRLKDALSNAAIADTVEVVTTETDVKGQAV